MQINISIMQKFLQIIIAAIFIYIGTILEFSLLVTDIPQTAQTVAVLCAGAILGMVWGGLAVALFVLAGILGLPVYSDGGYGIDHLFGASGGYLVGFIFGACFLGFWKKLGFTERIGIGFIGMLFGHMIILAWGWAWLATQIGMIEAYNSGIAPFYLGSLAKSLIAIFLVLIVDRIAKALKES